MLNEIKWPEGYLPEQRTILHPTRSSSKEATLQRSLLILSIQASGHPTMTMLPTSNSIIRLVPSWHTTHVFASRRLASQLKRRLLNLKPRKIVIQADLHGMAGRGG